MANETTHFSWPRPSVSGDLGTWGNILNNTLGLVDSALQAVKDVANAALPRTGGTVTGDVVRAQGDFTAGAGGFPLAGTIISESDPSGTAPQGTLWLKYA